MSLTGKEKCAPNQDYTFIRSYVSFYHLIQKNQNRKSIFTFEPRFSQFNIHLMKKSEAIRLLFYFLNTTTFDGKPTSHNCYRTIVQKKRSRFEQASFSVAMIILL
uniref:(northern house mosquito) hypothetical protein n=1 Tax=Culex pipiens TaxID=7175 RepID=A0A8D8CXQ0_CULPI